MAAAENAPENRKRVLSGMRPTGRLHIGHYFGALQNWIRLQNDPQYECFYFIADWHALTTDYADTSFVAQNTIEIATDWLAAGLDPEKCTFFVQSSVPEHAELNLLLAMITPKGYLENVPTYKDTIRNRQDIYLHTYGFLGYPVLQTADIVMYGEPNTELVVPVGEDQAAHVELGREIVHRFNTFYGLDITEEFFRLESRRALVTAFKALENPFLASTAEKIIREKGAFSAEDRAYVLSAVRKAAIEVGVKNFLSQFNSDERRFIRFSEKLREPEVMLTHTPRIPGLDGRKMSKSYGNAIMLSESDDDIRKKTKVMVTDPARKRRTDPGNPDICPVYDWHKLFSPPPTLQWAADGCRSAGIGCIECKMAMDDNLIKWIAPVRARREEYAAHPDRVLRILDDGSTKAHEVAQKTMARVREAVFNWKEKRAEVAAPRVVGKS